jgi:UDP-glucose 4-epimerase
VIAIFTSKMLAGGQPVINGDGKQTRDYTFVGDVVCANMFALEYEQSGIFNVGTGIETDVNQLFAHLKRFSGARCEEQHAPAKKGEQLRSVLDYGRIKKLFGWQPTISLEDGLTRTVQFFREKKTR